MTAEHFEWLFIALAVLWIAACCCAVVKIGVLMWRGRRGS